MLYDDADEFESIDPSVPSHCRKRQTAQRLLQSGEVTVAFPLLGKADTYWQKSKDQPLPAPDSSLFPVEKVYRASWVHERAKPNKSLDATFIVSKQPRTPGGLCTNYPRHQVFNHVEIFRKVTVKSSLARTMRSFARKYPSRADELKQLVPASFWLSSQADCNDFQKQVHSGMWIRKQDFKHNSMGVRLLSDQEAMKLAKTCSTKAPHVLVQQYLPDPLLVAGRKCDFRVYLYVPVTVPLLAFYAPVWYMKCGHGQFNASSTDLENVVTNTKVAGKLRVGANYSELVLGAEQLQKQLSRQRAAPADFVQVSLASQIKKKLTLLMEVIEAESAEMPNVGFELLGCDMMLDEHLNLWLIEVNMSPQLEASLGARKTAVDAIVPLVTGTQLDLLRFAASGRPRLSLDPEKDLPSKGNLELIYRSDAR